MQQLLPQRNFIIPNANTAGIAINVINTYIESKNCKEVGIDISYMNIPDACYVATMCSAKHFIKYPDGKIEWKVSSPLVKELNERLSLGNDFYII